MHSQDSPHQKDMLLDCYGGQTLSIAIRTGTRVLTDFDLCDEQEPQRGSTMNNPQCSEAELGVNNVAWIQNPSGVHPFLILF